MTPVERQVRILMRAWPIPDRIERGNEIVGTTLDLVPDGRSRLPLALAINLVVGGLRARWKMRPPLWRYLWYRNGGRLPTRWHRWMLNDLSRPGWLLRRVVFQMVTVLLSLTVAFAVFHPPGGPDLRFMLPFSIVFLAGVLTSGRRKARKERDRQLARHGYLQAAQQSPSGPPPSPTQPNGHQGTGSPSQSMR
jgi:hypothetical protein